MPIASRAPDYDHDCFCKLLLKKMKKWVVDKMVKFSECEECCWNCAHFHPGGNWFVGDPGACDIDKSRKIKKPELNCNDWKRKK